jgi:hypothetical protein
VGTERGAALSAVRSVAEQDARAIGKARLAARKKNRENMKNSKKAAQRGPPFI